MVVPNRCSRFDEISVALLLCLRVTVDVIKDHLNWRSNAAKAGFIPVRRPFISKIIKYLPEQEIISLAEYVVEFPY